MDILKSENWKITEIFSNGIQDTTSAITWHYFSIQHLDQRQLENFTARKYSTDPIRGR